MMQKDIANIVVVRFSVRVRAWKNRLFFNEKSRESWFKYRADLYAHTLGRSLDLQSQRPVRVYLLMDQGDRPLCEKYFQEQNFTPIFSDNAHFQEIANDLRRLGIVNNVAMTRIDSDDIVERLYFEKINTKIQELDAKGADSALITTCCGYRTNFVEIQSVFHSAPPFITLYKKCYGGENVYSHDHRDVGAREHIKDVSAEWMQVIHGTNVANKFKPANAESLGEYISGDMGSGFTQRKAIDADWFKAWSGFELPDPSLFDQAPLGSVRSRIRRFWREISGKI